MRPRDFPERKNLRRRAALSRIGSRNPNVLLTAAERAEYLLRLGQETLALHERIVPSAFGIRSRKIDGPGVLNRRAVGVKGGAL